MFCLRNGTICCKIINNTEEGGRAIMKKTMFLFFILMLCMFCAGSFAERKTVVKDEYYIGAMRVVKCKEYVSLREGPYKTSKQLETVPLDDIVYYCSNNVKKYDYSPYKAQIPKFIHCEYNGVEGYILKKYLEPAPEFEPVETKAEKQLMSRDEIIGSGKVVLEWKEFNVSVLAAYEQTTEDNKNWEHLRVGCFIDDEPAWGYIESVEKTGSRANLNAFMGGTEDEPQVYVYDAEYGLIMLDLMDGEEGWTLMKTACSLGDASVFTVGANTGILYVTGSDGPDPIAISAEGSVLWRSEIDDPDVYGPESIKLNPNDIEICYESGQTVKLEYDGEVISILDSSEGA